MAQREAALLLKKLEERLVTRYEVFTPTKLDPSLTCVRVSMKVVVPRGLHMLLEDYLYGYGTTSARKDQRHAAIESVTLCYPTKVVELVSDDDVATAAAITTLKQLVRAADRVLRMGRLPR